jgi:hypothetical protein
MAASWKHWKIALRCYECGERFTMPYAAFKDLQNLPLVALCPSCGTRPLTAAETGGPHDILDISETKVFRKSRDGDTWHFAEDCSQWPDAEFTERRDPPTHDAFCNECVVLQETHR